MGEAEAEPPAPHLGQPLLIRATGRDRPRVIGDLLGLLARAGAEIEDLEQLVVRERLTLDVLVRIGDADSSLIRDILYWGHTQQLAVDFEHVEATSQRSMLPRHAITVLGESLTSAALAAVSAAVADTSGTIDRIVRLATEPVTAYDLSVIADDVDELRRRLMQIARDHQVDIAVQAGGLERRAKRLVVMDVDSTLIRNEMIDLLAAEAGSEDAVATITERAMRGELDFEQSLRERVRLLKGLDGDAIERVRSRIRLTPGARTFVRTLKRLGYAVAIVSGGFTIFTDWLQQRLDLDHAYGNTIEIVDGRLTGEILGSIVDRARKAELLAEIADTEGVPLSQTVAIGDGANDLDMLAAAGMGIAFNAKPAVREQAAVTVSVPYLDAILFMLGLRGTDVDHQIDTGRGNV